MKEVKILIKQWAAIKGHSFKRVQETRKKLDIAAALERKLLSIYLQTKNVELRGNVQTLLLREEADLKQRSKVTWVKEGDENTRVFSIAAKQRNAIDSTLKVLNREINQNVTRIQIETNSMVCFKNLFSRN